MRNNKCTKIFIVKSASSSMAIITSLHYCAPVSAQIIQDSDDRYTPVYEQIAQDPDGRYDMKFKGVDLNLGYFAETATDISIGANDDALEFSRVYRSGRRPDVEAVNVGASHSSQSIFINCWGYNYNTQPATGYPLCRGEGMNVFIAGEWYPFNRVSGAFVSFYTDGSSLTESDNGLIFSTANGTEYNFTKASSNWCGMATCLLVDKVKRPNGNVLTYSYEVAFNQSGGWPAQRRLTQVIDSYGNGLTFSYISPAGGTAGGDPTLPYTKKVTIASVSAFNNTCADSSSESCSTGSLPSVNYVYTDQANGQPLRLDTVSKGGQIFNLTWSAQNLVSTAFSGQPPAYTNTYVSGRVTEQSDQGGRNWRFTRTFSGSATTKTEVYDPENNKTTFNYIYGYLSPFSVVDAEGKVTSYEYYSTGQIKKVTLPEQNSFEFTYDSRGNLTKRRAISKTPGTPPDIVLEWDFEDTCTSVVKCNKPIWSKDANLNQTDYEYDNVTGQIKSITLPEPAAGAGRPQTRYAYTNYQGYWNVGGTISPSGKPVSMLTSISTCSIGSAPSCVGTVNESRTTLNYGPQTVGTANNLALVSATVSAGDGSLSAVTSFVYDIRGNLITSDGPLSGTGDTTRLFYDSAQRMIGKVGPDPDGGGTLFNRALRYTYGGNGSVSKIEAGTTMGQSASAWADFSALNSVTLDYNSGGDLIKQTFSAGGQPYAVQQLSYDNVGRLECTAQRMTSSAWDSLPTSATAACEQPTPTPSVADRISRIQYDVVGRISAQQSAYGVTTANGFPATLQRNEVTSSFTNNGRLASVADAKGNKTTYEYDGFDRLAKTRYPSPTTAGSSSTTDYEQPIYDANSNVTALRLRDGQSIAFTYDNLNRLTFKNLPGAEPDVTYAYDLLGRMTSASQPGSSLTFGYDALSRLTFDGQSFGSMAYQYDLAGRRTRATWNDGFYVSYDYLMTGEMTAIRENGAASGVGVLASFAYDNLGNRTGVMRGNGSSTSYSFDGASRLLTLVQNLAGTASDQSLGFAYNAASQIISRSASNDAYAMRQQWNAARVYSANGLNQYVTAGGATPVYDARGNMTAAGATSYSYNAENRLKSTSGGVSLYYDSIGRLHEYDTSVSTRFMHDGGQIVAEVANPSGAIQRRYVYGPGADEALVWYEGSGTGDRRWLHADERGSIIAASNSSGNMIGVNAYDEWGNPQSGNIGRFGYTGQAWLAEAGLWYYKARMYNPRLGRFMQTDPIGYGDGMNWYDYVGGDPINKVDPSGMTVSGYCGGVEAPGGGGDCIVIPDSSAGSSSGTYGTSYGPSPSQQDFGGQGALGAILQNLRDIPANLNKGPLFGPLPQSIDWSDDCADTNDSFADAGLLGLEALGYLGTSVQIAGILTANPLLITGGTALAIGADVGKAAIHAQQGDVDGLIGDGVGVAAGFVPTGRLFRAAGGARASWGRLANGRFTKNSANRIAAQDAAFSKANGTFTSGANFCQRR